MSDRIYNIPYKPTIYEGIPFKSVLEVRWHIFFETLGIVTEYEPMRFYLHEFDGTDYYIYTPDFGIISQGYDYLEIKPTTPTAIEYAKCRALSDQGYRVALFAGGCNPDVQVYLFEDGIRRYIPRSSAFLQQCFQFKLNGRQGETVAALKVTLGRGNYTKAFKAAWGFKA